MIWLLCSLALASAAPYYHHDHHYRPSLTHAKYEPRDWSADDYFGGEIFDARKFWEDLAAEMHRFDQMMADFTKHFPNSVATEALVGDEYKVTITLTGFDEKDIVVKAREGLLMIEAVHKDEDANERTYLDLRTLPSYVNVTGNWMYEKGVLTIVFPVTEKPEVLTESPLSTTTENGSDVPQTEDHSREEMAPKSNDNKNGDADVGLERGDKDTEILSNEIPKESKIEATTYAVDLKGDVEFVPIRY